MVVNAHTVCIFVALVQFIFAAIGWPITRINWVASGLATFMLSLLIR